MLGAFLTPELRDRLLRVSDDAETESYDRVENHWLLRKSAAAAFTQGYFQLSLYKKSKSGRVDLVFPPIHDKVEEFRRASFVDHSSSNVNIPNRWALEVLSCFATPVRWTYIAQEIASKQRRKQSPAAFPSPFSSASSFLSDACAAIFKKVWLLVPGNIRIRAYCGLVSLGAHMYGFNDSLNVQQLPFGLYLKVVSAARREGLVNEHATLELIRRHTNIPVPRALDLIWDSNDVYLLTARIPGYKLGLCIDGMSDQDTRTLVQDLRRHMIALRAVPRPLGWKHAISNAVDGPCFDYRINMALNYDEDRGEVVGPFLSEHDFNDTLRCGALPGVVHRGGHNMVFTHGDLNLRNVLVDSHGRLAGIVDWENAGWFPEYCNYTKAYFVTKMHWPWLRMVDDVFAQFGDFGHELAVERELWNYCF
ncbi:kinase-like domain-containing protein [Chaetomidium leptoderma]|uniref:Kinase-like domain-containing protein n=1 Tax=Chaetomidium leptoderma TaxID=669021 RepID=A0AAN6VR69_9PEZI|nr:kinase-like domain-containing protein [Chaetomidium leptoderma]